MTALIFDCISTASGRSQVGVITLNRPEKANAFDEHLILEFLDILNSLDKKNLRLLVLKAQGAHFCAGADLGWMKASAQKTHQENFQDSKLLQDLFYRWACVPVPTIACVQGSVFGGGLGLVAASDITIAQDHAKFCLSEGKLGLIPSVIFPFLTQKISLGVLKRLGLTCQVFDAQEALSYGLIHRVTTPDQISGVLNQEVQRLLQVSPQSHQKFKKIFLDQALFSLNDLSWCEKIADIRQTPEAVEGLKAFFEKRQPFYVDQVELP